MIRFVSALVAFLLAVSCVGTQIGDDVSLVPDPVTECVVPASACCGDEVILQWNGFADDAGIILRSSSVQAVPQISVITGSGLIFRIPFDVIPGRYDIILIQNGEYDLGEIEIREPAMPVSGLSVPASAMAGEEVKLSGAGFDNTSVISLAGSDSDIELETDLVNGGVMIVIPEDIMSGEYAMYLHQQGYCWRIADSFMITTAAKRLSSVSYTGPYFGTAEVEYTWHVAEGEMPVIRLTERLIDGADITEGSEDVYSPTDLHSWELASDGFEMSNDMSMSYAFDADGKIESANVMIYGRSQPTLFTWEYDGSGRLCNVAYENKSEMRSFKSISYDNGNITQFGAVAFLYDDSGLKNHPLAPDVVWGYMAVMDMFNPFLYFPYLVGTYDVRSECLPTSMILNTGMETLTVALSYDFDSDGYVTHMSWNENGRSNRVNFTY